MNRPAVQKSLYFINTKYIRHLTVKTTNFRKPQALLLLYWFSRIPQSLTEAM